MADDEKKNEPEKSLGVRLKALFNIMGPSTETGSGKSNMTELQKELEPKYDRQGNLITQK
jgi:hypothetical protein